MYTGPYNILRSLCMYVCKKLVISSTFQMSQHLCCTKPKCSSKWPKSGLYFIQQLFENLFLTTAVFFYCKITFSYVKLITVFMISHSNFIRLHFKQLTD